MCSQSGICQCLHFFRISKEKNRATKKNSNVPRQMTETTVLQNIPNLTQGAKSHIKLNSSRVLRI